MRLIAVLLALAVVGLLVAGRLGGGPSAPVRSVEPALAPRLPAVPARPADVPHFEQALSNGLDEAARRQRERIEAAETGDR